MRKQTFTGIATASALALLLAGCSNGGNTAEPDENGMVDATIGVIPIADTAPLYLGVEQGFFEDEGVNLTIETASGGAAIVPAVVAGDYEFGFSNTLSLMIGIEKGLPIETVAPAVASSGDPESDFGALIVRSDSGIADVSDLEGKRVSSNSTGNINDTIVRTLVDDAGADSSTIEFSEVPFPDAIAAVEANQVDAAFVVEPFVTSAQEAGLQVLTYTYASFDPKLDVAAYFASNAFVAENADIVERFQAAMTKSLEYAQENPDEVRRIIATYTKTPPEVLAEIVLPTFPTEMSAEGTEKLAQAAVDYGVLTEMPDLDAFLP
ncbi:ABC transporter substrate-binding protein [Salinibacterium sp. SYSU T00001]|uniref:ABC transporter substrate-binding protein n=1 Tax=Homoserinimonas sedimenticola TaxID=2986805 RepID=UPI002235A45C|nr:ABC transporter substrate-binding protein [Salinibacterium sedimenticola]MCW4386036.1 ABC transporter substrate-binding protein [Salinibacterium sedimenticola]